MTDPSETQSESRSGWIKETFQDDNGRMSSGRILCFWGYVLITILIGVDFLSEQEVPIDLYIWLIGASAGGKHASKFFETRKS